MRTFLLFFLATSSVVAQQPVQLWNVQFGGSGSEIEGGNRSVCKSHDGGYVWVGSSTSDDGDVPGNNGGYDVYVVKFDTNGNIVWKKNYGGSLDDKANSIYPTSDDGFLIAGTANTDNGDYTNGHGDNDALLIKLNSSGNLQWQKVYGGSLKEENVEGLQTSDDNYVFICRTESDDGNVGANSAGEDIWIVKVDNNGSIIWKEILSSTLDEYSAFTQTENGGFVLTFSYVTEGIIFDYLVGALITLDENGNEIGFGGLDINYPQSIRQTNDGGFIVSGFNTGGGFDIAPNPFNVLYNGLLQKLNSAGQTDWVYHWSICSFLGCTSTRLFAAREDENGDILAIGNSGDSDPSSGNTYHVLDANGYLKYITAIPGDGTLLSLQQDNSGGVILGGKSDNSQGWLVKLQEQAILPPSVSSEYCVGQDFQITVELTLGGSLAPYEVWLSDADGDFSNPTIIGTSDNEIIECHIPSEIPPGDAYRVKIRGIPSNELSSRNSPAITIVAPQSLVFTESMGAVLVTTQIADHESADGFDNDNLTMSGTATVNSGDQNPSVGYTGASGSAGIYLDNAGTENFLISGINTTGLSAIELSFGIYCSHETAIGIVEVSTDGNAFTPLTLPSPVVGWSLVKATGAIPSTPNLWIRFSRSAAAVGAVRVDDVMLTYDNGGFEIVPDGPTNFCDEGSVDLSVPGQYLSYSWSTGATTQTITATESGLYSCTVSTANNCNSTTAEIEVTAQAHDYFIDQDGDGFGVNGTQVVLCAPDATHPAQVGGDCEDNNAEINPGKTELCNGIDDNCDGQTDEGFDLDNDSYTTCGGDCDDNNAAIHPGASEISNSIDDNCDGLTDQPSENIWYLDNDGDGYGSPFHVSNNETVPIGYVANALDCDDDDASRYPTADDGCGDNIDNNCDGLVDNCVCVGDLDNNGAVNVGDLLIFTSVFGNVCP